MAVESIMHLKIGDKAPNFELPDTNGNLVSRDGVLGTAGMVVCFICNHCPFVKHVRSVLANLGNELPVMGVGFVGISSNNVEEYPDDSPEMMAKEVIDAGYTFPYLYDESQEVAKEYGAVCTPDVFLFDADLQLVYHGQLDDTRPSGIGKATGEDLREAVNQMLAGKEPLKTQKPAIGCSIKWKPGNEPSYA
jgi:peroxiredoxin